MRKATFAKMVKIFDQAWKDYTQHPEEEIDEKGD